MSLPVNEHEIIHLKLEGPVMPDFFQLVYNCSCGATHFWLLTSNEVEVAVNTLGLLRYQRKEGDETVLQEDLITQDSEKMDVGPRDDKQQWTG